MENCKYFYIVFFKIKKITSLKMEMANYFSKTEIWSHDEKDDAVSIKIADPNLNNYAWYSQLFIVESDFCTKK